MINFSINVKIYPKEAVIGACYKFIDRMYVFLDQAGKDKISVKFAGKTRMTPKQLEDMRGEFFNELLHYSLRLQVAKQNRKIREFIVGRALFSTIEGGESKTEDFQDDPLGIAVPWEEKYGDKK